MTDKMKVDILVLNYNGRDLMESFLPSICEAARRSLTECAVHVVDNRSSDGSVEFLEKNFPSVKLHMAKENKVLCSYNDVVCELDSDIVIFLNNDIKVEPDFADHLLKHFKDVEVMFVAPRLMNFDGTYNGGRSYLKFERGMIKAVVDKERYNQAGTTQAISTGAFRREAFLRLGGFDELYLPGIWEDVDLCFRGQRLGWKGVYEPKSVIWHDESTTFHREFGKKGKMRLAHRNMFLFFWKNITDVPMFVRHVLLAPPRLVFLYLLGRRECLEGFFMAVGRIPLVIKKRNKWMKEKSKRVLGDRDIIR